MKIIYFIYRSSGDNSTLALSRTDLSSITTAFGSAVVRQGNTAVTAAVKAEVGPLPPEPAFEEQRWRKKKWSPIGKKKKEGKKTSNHLLLILSTIRFLHRNVIELLKIFILFSISTVANVELTPLCSPIFKVGKPSEQAQSLATMLNNLIADLDLVDVKQITVDEQRGLVWYLFVDMYCLDYDGNIFDAALLALIAALRDGNTPT
ncbi:Exosome complex component RRP43 [Coelomomyces lativittatus]|nr:Exosome complex component RRP43 [Coelomomyces lativittatus]